MRRTEVLLLFDTSLLVTVCVLEAVSLTGLSVHEWLALAFAGVLLVHLLLQWPWIATRTLRLLAPRARRGRANYLLNLGLFIAMVATIASGIMISEVALPAVGRPNIGGKIEGRN
jgi:ABC-type transport system involved in cytochrome bd biosynthesis fused ATPase/permease subunit